LRHEGLWEREPVWPNRIPEVHFQNNNLWAMQKWARGKLLKWKKLGFVAGGESDENLTVEYLSSTDLLIVPLEI
jgi:hypothetical protein